VKDAHTTTESMGFRVTGYIFKDENGNNVEKEFKPHHKAKAEMLHGLFEKFFKTGGRDEVNTEAVDYFKSRTREMLDYFENYNSSEIIGSSLFFMLDNTSNFYDMRIIDISSVVDYEDLNKRDEGYIKGLKSIIEVLNQF
jgi:hypothetical protein